MARFVLLLCLTSTLAAVPVPEGAAPADDPAVLKALGFLTKAQGDKGEWHIRNQYQVGPTGLVVLAYLSAGIGPDDKTHGEALKKAVAFLLTTQVEKGVFKEPRTTTEMYSHGIATWALSEHLLASGKDAPENLKPALEKAVRVIVESQGRQGGWRYQARPLDGDASITSWQLLALRAVAKAGIRVPEQTFKSAREFLDKCHRPGGGFAYTPGGAITPGCTAAGTLHLLLAGEATDGRDMLALRGLVLKQIPAANTTYVLYTHHYQAQVLTRIGGKEAEAGLAQIRERLLKLQTEQGSVQARQGSEASYGPHLCTPLAILALTAKDRRLAVLKADK